MTDSLQGVNAGTLMGLPQRGQEILSSRKTRQRRAAHASHVGSGPSAGSFVSRMRRWSGVVSAGGSGPISSQAQVQAKRRTAKAVRSWVSRSPSASSSLRSSCWARSRRVGPPASSRTVVPPRAPGGGADRCDAALAAPQDGDQWLHRPALCGLQGPRGQLRPARHAVVVGHHQAVEEALAETLDGSVSG